MEDRHVIQGGCCCSTVWKLQTFSLAIFLEKFRESTYLVINYTLPCFHEIFTYDRKIPLFLRFVSCLLDHFYDVANEKSNKDNCKCTFKIKSYFSGSSEAVTYLKYNYGNKRADSLPATHFP